MNKLPESKNEKPNWKFFAMLSGLTISFLSGLYFLYSLFSQNDLEISDEQKEKIEELVQISNNINDGENSNTQNQIEKKESESLFAIKIFKQINELSEEIFLKENSNWIQTRRGLLKDNKKDEYDSYCEKLLSEKMRIETQATELIIQKLGMSQYELQSIMEKIPQKDFLDLQQEMHDKQKNTSNRKNEEYKNEEILKAFKEFIKLKNNMDNDNSKHMGNIFNEPNEEAKIQFFLKLEIHKYYVDDYLSINFDMDFNKLMFLVNSRELFKNSEISEDYKKIMKEFDQGE